MQSILFCARKRGQKEPPYAKAALRHLLCSLCKGEKQTPLSSKKLLLISFPKWRSVNFPQALGADPLCRQDSETERVAQ